MRAICWLGSALTRPGIRGRRAGRDIDSNRALAGVRHFRSDDAASTFVDELTRLAVLTWFGGRSMYVGSATFTIAIPNGRLAFDVSGKSAGSPIFLLHGMPGSRRGPRPRPGVLYRLGVNLITYDRAGYGGSTRRSG